VEAFFNEYIAVKTSYANFLAKKKSREENQSCQDPVLGKKQEGKIYIRWKNDVLIDDYF